MHKRYLTVLAALGLALLVTAAARAADPAPAPRGVPLPADYQAPAVNNGECLGANLLNNPSFEGAYSSYVPPGGHPDCPSGVCGTAQMAAGWTPFWYTGIPKADGWETAMPEYKPAEFWFVNPDRVRSGERAQQYFNFWKTQDAGLYQQVSVTPGVAYCFSAYGHSWSADDNDDALSGPFHGQLNQYVGIDPTGGTDPNAAAVVWGAPRYQYDIFDVFQVGAVAQSSTLTVFMRSDAWYPVQHNDVYWDDAALTTMSFATAHNAHFLQAAGAGSVEQRVIDIMTTGPASLSWSAQVNGGATMPISLAESSGDGGDDLVIIVDGRGIGAGVYSGTVTLTPSEPIPGTPLQIPVRLTVVDELSDTFMPAGLYGP